MPTTHRPRPARPLARRRPLWILGPVALAAALASCDAGSAGDDGGGDASWVAFATGEYTVASGEEKYLCWSQTLTEPLYVDRFEYEKVATVHHFFMQKALVKEPEGFSECDVLFKPTWLPLFGAATSDAELQMPDGAAMIIPAGDQIVVQLHLLNATPEDVSERAVIRMHRSDVGPAATPVGWYAFGTSRIQLPAGQKTEVRSLCAVDQGATVFAGGPHMHYLGKKSVLEVGPSKDALATTHVRDPYSFDRQSIDPLPLELAEGELVQLTCTFDNRTDHTVTFGESSNDEMCYFVMFATGFEGIRTCRNLEEPDVAGATDVPNDPSAGLCEDIAANDLGVGAPCTGGLGDCASGLSCTMDNVADGGGQAGFCMKIACESDADCGSGYTTCCAPAEAGGLLNVCLPEACRPTDCIPQ
ncbi:MAG: hypothetical protein KC635_13140 [Myxococcales bacterium]|nr:hypothetical protein [Myxococcales bacterium]MCB9736427.1 hypothetical protein [Deltaproteobacteria bacterium]